MAAAQEAPCMKVFQLPEMLEMIVDQIPAVYLRVNFLDAIEDAMGFSPGYVEVIRTREFKLHRNRSLARSIPFINVTNKEWKLNLTSKPSAKTKVENSNNLTYGQLYGEARLNNNWDQIRKLDNGRSKDVAEQRAASLSKKLVLGGGEQEAKSWLKEFVKGDLIASVEDRDGQDEGCIGCFCLLPRPYTDPMNTKLHYCRSCTPILFKWAMLSKSAQHQISNHAKCSC